MVVWFCDLMYGNIIFVGGYKICLFDWILKEVEVFFVVYCVEGIYVGGVYVEMIGCNVIECIGGVCVLIEE